MGVQVQNKVYNSLSYEIKADGLAGVLTQTNKVENGVVGGADSRTKLVHVKNALETSNMSYKFACVPATICKLGQEVAILAKSTAAYTAFQGPGAIFSKMAGGFIIPYATYCAIKFSESIEKFSKSCNKSFKAGVTEDDLVGNGLKMAKNGCASVSTACFSLLAFAPSNGTLKTAAAVAGLGESGFELKEDVDGYKLMGRLATNLPVLAEQDEMQKQIQSDLAMQKKVHLFGMIKNTASAVGAVFGLLAIVFAAAVVPSIVCAVVGAVALSFSFVKHFYSEDMAREIKFKPTFA